MKESPITNFRSWLEGIEEYEPWRARIQGIFRGSFPFRYMFPQDRIYVPFQPQGQTSEAQEDITRMLSDFGYTIADWQKGLAQKQGDRRVYRISKILQQAERKDIEEVEQDYTSGKLSPVKYRSTIESTRRYYTQLTNDFQNDVTRTNANALSIVFSCNPHDLASMSTGRGWTSCMQLGTGSHHSDVFCEVKEGGFIAYLIRSDDKNIQKPLARIHIRRFVNKKNVSLALPEETVYGQEVPGFLEKVKEWLMEKQKIHPGTYRRMGGEYSDTWGSDRKVVIDPTNPKTIQRWIEKWIDMPDDQKWSKIKYFHSAVTGLLGSDYQWPKDFLEKVKQALFDYKVPSHSGWQSTATPISLVGTAARFALKFPDTITQEDFKRIFPQVVTTADSGGLADRLLQKFAQFADEEILQKVGKWTKGKVVKANPSLVAANRRMINQDIMANLHVDNPDFSVRDNRQGSIYGVQGRITDMMDGLQEFSPIPEPLVQKVIELANNVDKLQLLEPEQDPASKKVQHEVTKVKRAIIGHAIHVFAHTKTDTPSVQRFYQSLLPQWKELGGIGQFGWAIAQLGENGKQFLPFIKQQMKEFEAEKDKLVVGRMNPEKLIEETLEDYRYIIDCLERGTTTSPKYDFNHGVQADAWEKRQFPWS